MFESFFDKVAGLKAYNFIKRRLQHFPVNIAKILRTAFFIEHLRCLLLGFLQDLLKITEENHFSVEFFSEISYKLFHSLSCSVSKYNFLQVFHSFRLSFNMSGVCRTQSNIKMEPFAKIVNSSKGVFKTESNI